jgi:hypothetical protein
MHTVLLHTVDVQSDTLMERVFGAGSVGINSYHHQAVKDLGAGCGPTATRAMVLLKEWNHPKASRFWRCSSIPKSARRPTRSSDVF